MIDITIKLNKGHVFLCGENVECCVSFTHVKSTNARISQSNVDTIENLAWGSAQIHCQCFTSPKIKKENASKNSKLNTSFADTALGIRPESGIIYASEPRILFCDLKLLPGQSKTYVYTEKLPNDCVPTCRGQLVKYCYKITIGTQRVNHTVKLLKIPIRVLPIISIPNELNEICNETTEELTPTNPFLIVHKNENPLNLALQTLRNITARRNPNFFMISNKRGKVARFCLFKSAYKLGEDIVGSLDFTVGINVNCMQLSVALQCQIEVDGCNTETKSFSKHHEVCHGYQQTQLVLPIPLHVTPAFETDLISLKWNLHFEFVTSVNPVESWGLDKMDWQAPGEVDIETMVWTLPIQLYSTTPAHVSQGVQSYDMQSLVI